MLCTHSEGVFIHFARWEGGREIGGWKGCERYKQGISTLIDDYHGYALATAAIKVSKAAGYTKFDVDGVGFDRSSRMGVFF